MTLSKFNQKGFGLVEGLLITIIVLLVGFIGYYVYNAQKDADKNLSKPANTSTTQTTAKKKVVAQNDFTITEWGIQGKIDATVTPQYKVTNDGQQTWAMLSSTELATADTGCGVEQQAGGIINRAMGTERAYNNAGEDVGMTIQQEVDKGILTGYKKIGGYYYWFSQGQAFCGSAEDATRELQHKVYAAYADAVKTFEAIPAN